MQVYEELWASFKSAIERGEPQIDAHLSNKPNDLRRGITIALRPSLSVQSRVRHLLDRLALVCPEQYFYRPEELHVTVLSIISGTEFWRREIRHLAACRAILRDVLSHQPSFKIRFCGVTASPGSVMIQGFPMSDELVQIRDALRDTFDRNGFGEMLDRRYKISTAHMTAMRFCELGGDWKRLASLLEENRGTDFGETEVNSLQLVWGDWYASAGIVRTLHEYRLVDCSPLSIEAS